MTAFNYSEKPCQKSNNALLNNKGLCTLAKFVGENVSNSDKQQTGNVLVLATLGSVTKIGSFLFVSHHPRQPREIQ